MSRSRRRGDSRSIGSENTPPRVAQAILRLTAPNRYRDQQLGDLRAAFFTQVAQTGRPDACRWYRQQVLKSLLPNLATRVRHRSRARRRGRAGVPVLFGQLAQDLNYAVRSIRRRPAFHSAVMLVFTLGIGANTMIFSVVDGVVLKPLPYPEPDRLVMPWQTDLSLLTSAKPWRYAAARRIELPYPVYEDWLEQNTVFQELGVYQGTTYIVTGDGPAERIRGTQATHGVLAAIGVPPMLGRTFVAADDLRGGQRYVILGHGVWLRRFGSDSSVIGRTMLLNERPYTIVGVMPRGFGFPRDSEIWTTFNHANTDLSERDSHVVVPVARLRSGITLDQAQSEMEILAESLEEAYAIPGEDYGVNVVRLADDVVRDVRPALLLLLGTVGVFLIIACANIANLVLVRASERRNELAVRLSLGAGRGRILRQLLTEGLVLSIGGGALGPLVAISCVDPFVAILPPDTPRLDAIGLNARVLTFSALLTILTGTAVGALPAIGTMRARLATVFQDANRRSSASRHHGRTHGWLLVSQITLTFVLLVGAGLLIKSFTRLTSTERGFDAEGMLTLDIDVRGSRYRSDSRQRPAFEELYERLRAIPGVTDVGASRAGPFMSRWSHEVRVETAAGQVTTSPLFDFVSDSYFRTMGVPLLAGRTFSADERFRASPVVIVNEAMARTLWPNESAIGKRIIWEHAVFDSTAPWLTVVGVVGNVRRRLEDDPFPAAYYPLYYGNPTVVLKTAVPPASVRDAVQEAVRAVDSTLPIVGVRILEQTIGSSIAGPRVRTFLVSGLAALAATLAVVGIFGVLAYSVAQRTNEIGIRMALGAASSNVVRAVVLRGLKLLSIGVAFGMTISLAASRVIEGFLFDVDPIDPATLLTVTFLLAAAAMAASYIPARRAAKVDPVEALRRE